MAKYRQVNPNQLSFRFATTDFYGGRVVMLESSAQHAESKHGFTDFTAAEDAVRNPMRIRESTVPYATALCYETMSTAQEHIRVPVHYPQGVDPKQGQPGEAKTAYVVHPLAASRVGKVIYESASSTLPPAK